MLKQMIILIFVILTSAEAPDSSEPRQLLTRLLRVFFSGEVVEPGSSPMPWSSRVPLVLLSLHWALGFGVSISTSLVVDVTIDESVRINKNAPTTLQKVSSRSDGRGGEMSYGVCSSYIPTTEHILRSSLSLQLNGHSRILHICRGSI